MSFQNSILLKFSVSLCKSLEKRKLLFNRANTKAKRHNEIAQQVKLRISEISERAAAKEKVIQTSNLRD